MDPLDYRDARWFALLRAATEIGVPEQDAPALVERVLARHQRRIRRAEDPDLVVLPAVRAASEDLLSGGRAERPVRRWRGPAVLVAVLALVAAGVALTRPEQPLPDRLRADQVPSLFGYDEADARALLEARGLRVEVEPFRACEVSGRVLASDPPTGARYDEGDAVTVYSAVPADVACLTDYQDRVTAWQLLEFADGRGPAPPFDDRVFVYPGQGPPLILDRSAAEDPAAWSSSGVLDGLRSAARRVALVDEHPLTYAVPGIEVAPTADGTGPCGVPSTAATGSGDGFALSVTSPSGTGCPARVEVYRSGGAIVAIAYAPASG